MNAQIPLVKIKVSDQVPVLEKQHSAAMAILLGDRIEPWKRALSGSVWSSMESPLGGKSLS